MTLTITVPGLGKPKTVKDAVISTLTREWPLSTRKLHNSVRKAGISATYQAVHKAIRELTEKGILDKQGKNYQLSKTWIGKLDRFVQDLGQSQEQKKAILDQDVTNFTFHTVFEFYKFFLELFCDNLLDLAEDEKPIATMNHMWWSLVGTEKEQIQFKNFMEAIDGGYILSKNDTPGDRMLMEFYLKTGPHIKIKLGAEIPEDYDTVVIRDYVIQVYFPENVKRMFDLVYSKLKGLEPTNIKEFYDVIMNTKMEILVVINRNPKLAKMLKERVARFFKPSK